MRNFTMSPRLMRFLTAYLLMLIGSILGYLLLFFVHTNTDFHIGTENAWSLILLSIMVCTLPFVSAVFGPIFVSCGITLCFMHPPIGMIGVTVVVLGIVLQYYLLSCAYQRVFSSSRVWLCWIWRLYLVVISMFSIYNLMYLGSQ